jgi:hypothetical protein
MPPSASGLSRRLLAALVPPGSIEAEVGILQSAIFSAHGFISAIALPPIIPIGFLPGRSGSSFMQNLPKTSPSPDFRVMDYSWEGGGLYLRLVSSGLWTALRLRLEEAPGAARVHAPFTAAEGFCLGCWEAPAERRPDIPPVLPALHFTSCSLALVLLRARFDSAEWWREIHMEIAAKKPLR